MGQNVLVSVVIPAYNSAMYIRQTLESVLNQTYPHIEIIVVDDGSTDNTMQILHEYGDKVKPISQNNQGSAVARNAGVQAAKGEWIAFIDSDDTWKPEKVEVQLNLAGKYQWSHTDYVFFGEGQSGQLKSTDTSPKYGDEVFTQLVVENFIGTSTVMIRRQVFLDSHGFDPAQKAIQDWELWLQLAAKYPLGYIDQVLSGYRVHPNSISRQARKTLPMHLKVIQKTFSQGGVGEKFHHLKSRALANSYGICSIISGQQKDALYSLVCALKALQYQPSNLLRWKRVLSILILEIPQFMVQKLKIN